MSGPAFVRMYPSAWRSGCLGLSIEQEGLYIRICMFIGETGRRVPLDDSQAAKMLGGMNVNQYRKVLGQLLMSGKIKRHENGYGNDRIEIERKKAAQANSKHSAQAEERPDREADPGCEREDNEVPVGVTHQVATPATTQDTPPSYPPSRVEKTQCFLRATKDYDLGLKEKEDTPLPPSGGPTPFEALTAFEAYNATALRCGLPQAAKFTPDRKRKIVARLRDYGSDGWSKALANIERSSFLTGTNDRGWRADLEFLLQPSSFAKVHDGGYGNGRHTTPKPITIPQRRGPAPGSSEYLEQIAREMGLS